MMKLDLEELILNLFKEDRMNNEQNTIFSQLALITIKSIIPSFETEGQSIDYQRFNQELELLKYYKIEDQEHLLIDIGEKEYFTNKDKTIYSRIIPIIIANRDFDNIEREVVQNILSTTGNIETLLEWLVISRLLFFIIDGKSDEIKELKEYIINMSQIEFLEKYKRYYLYDPLDEAINYQIKFEKSKINLISVLHGINIDRYKEIVDLLNVINGEKAKEKVAYIIESTINVKDIECEIGENYKRMSSYIMKLRKGRIDPKDLKIEEYVLPDIFTFNEGEMFFHSLLNNSKVLKKEIKDNSLTSLLETRSGRYLFKKDPLN